LPFIAVYGIFQPVLPATIFKPTKLIWQIIGLLRALGWYALLPLLILSFVAAAGQGSRKMRNLVLWLSLLVWTLILLASLRGGADLFDNPRYRTIFFVWQSILAGYVWIWWKETRNEWFTRVILMEVVFLLFFTQWYASRYFHWGGQIPFAVMVALILGLWAVILGVGLWRDRRRGTASAIERRNTTQSDSADKQGSPVDKSRA
jgi:peptidoglycan/LPS O-acetylase OafA/YrhL